MRATESFVKERFDRFNGLIFEGKLPDIPLVITNAASYLGMFCYKTRKPVFGKRRHYDLLIRISARLDLPESEIEDTVIHEMIHCWILLNGIRDTARHGKVFRSMMSDINSKYGRHITVSHRATKEQREAALDKRPRRRVVAILRFKDGREGVKCLPCMEARVKAYDRAFRRTGKIAEIEYYTVSDPWFNRFPTSSAFNVIFTDINEVRRHIISMGN